MEKKRNRYLIKLIAATLAVILLAPVQAYAAVPETVSPMASDYLAVYNAYIYPAGDGELQVWFSVTGTGPQDYLGALSVQLYESTDGSTWYPALPEQYRRSDTERKRDDEDCGYVPPGTYREDWFVVEGEYICGNDAENCNFQTLWVPLGYYFDETASGGVFNNKTIKEIPDICNGTQIRVCIGTFQNMSYITSAPSFDTRNVTNMRQMFYGCTALATVPQYNYANVEDISQMFYNCTSLTSDIDLSTATNLKVADNVFYRSGITSVVGLDASKLNLKGQYDTAWVIGGPNIETLHIDNLSNIILDVRTNTSLTNESFEYLFMHSASTAHRTTWIWVSQEQWDLQIYPNNYFELANERYNVNFTTSKPNI